ncbi:V-set domain-containing T-cell activation inhibitor 1 [Denticeps clupeoides]|uniref:Ig-like domain-containing protein n=1 Tax=Denticeps clupeoides TaxID=299321 RepID=A0AAY4D9N4_9TELE|nr:V-set domain-containing T-cell activation inhibitor 1 [Denticeps clupeoides]
MASIGQIIFWSMIVLIFVMAGFIILLLAIAFSRSQSFVQSSDQSPVGNLGQDVVLNCKFNPKLITGMQTNDVSITWTKAGLTRPVYRYQNQAAQLQDQDPQFKGRTQLFPDAIAGGNASLLLQRVSMVDEGVYQCSVSASGASGSVSIHLWVAAYSSPTFSRSMTTLTAEAPRWFPKPNVTWTVYQGDVLNASTEFFNNSAGIFTVVSTLKLPAHTNETYTCVIENTLVVAVSQATLTGDSGLTASTDYSFNSATPSRRYLHLLLIAPLLYSYFLT